MSAVTEAPDTPRRHLMTLAHRQLTFPHMTVEDEVACASVLADREARDRAFTSLCEALRQHDMTAAETVLDLLTGRLR